MSTKIYIEKLKLIEGQPLTIVLEFKKLKRKLVLQQIQKITLLPVPRILASPTGIYGGLQFFQYIDIPNFEMNEGSSKPLQK